MFKFLFLFTLFSLGFLFAETRIFAQEIKPNQKIVRELKGGETHIYTVQAKEENALRFVIRQHGVDVKVEINATNGSLLKAVDRPNGSIGRETVTFIAPNTAIYRVSIISYFKSAPSGKYQISLTVAEMPTETDQKRNIAENLTSDGENLRYAKKAETKQQAVQKFAAALEIWRELDDVYESAVCFYGLGWTHYDLSNFTEAAINFSRALNVMRELDDDYGQALNHFGLGTTEYNLNEYELAAYNFRQAIEIYRKLGNARSLGIALAGLGAVENLLENDQAAFSALTESLHWREMATDKNGEARTRIQLGKLFMRQKSFAQAFDQFNTAQNLLSEITDSEATAEVLSNFGFLNLAVKNPSAARGNFQTALSLAQKSGNKIGAAIVLNGLSRANMSLGELETARLNIEAALDIIETVRQATVEFTLRTKFTATVQNYFELYISLLMKMHDNAPAKGFDHVALQIAEQARARSLLDRLERREIIRQNKISPELLEREQNLTDTLTEIFARQRPNEKNITAEIQRISAQYLETEAEINRLFSLPETAKRLPITTSEIQQNLGDETVLLEYLLTDTDAFLWFVSNTQVKSFRLSTAEKIENTAREVYRCLSIPNGDEKVCQQKTSELSKILLMPTANDLNNKRIVVVAHSVLQYIPFEMLKLPNSANRYLVETNEIVSVPSASLLQFLRQPRQTPADKILAVFADPIFSKQDGRIKSAKTGKTATENSPTLPRLFASRFEAERISALVAPAKLLKKMDDDANRAAVFSSNLQQYRIIHFATHTFIDDTRPELSAIALSFFDKNGKEINGWLRSNDILRLDLNADLVVLSACRSGLGQQIKGEGIVSLANNFLVAGSKRLIVSLWDVNDKVTAELMIRFYRHYLNGESASKALQSAKIEMLRDIRWNSPFYWAAFTLQGDWQS